MSELTLYVAGMSCRRCVREVTARLRDVAGVETVATDAGRSHVRLTGSMTFPDVIHALVGTTYRAEIVRAVVEDVVNEVVKNRGETEAGQGCP
jgi:copper chaperone CopZ